MPHLAALAVAIIAAIADLRSRRVPNWLTLSALILGFVWHIAHGTWREAAWGALLGAVIYLPMWLAGGRGGGDVKLMAALGAWLGPSSWIQLFVLTALIGGIWALILVIAKRRLLSTLKNIGGILRSLVTGRRPAHRLGNETALAIPHAAIVALAMLAWLALMRPPR